MKRKVRIAGGALATFVFAPALIAFCVAATSEAPASGPTHQAPLAPGDSVAADLWLIGDAGLPKPGGEPVLKGLVRAVRQGRERGVAADSTLIVWLGDNIYPKGLPDSAGSARREAQRIIDEQVDAAREAWVRSVFIPGNHDWEAGGETGWRTVFRQGQHIDRRGEGRVVMLPKNGCPGPAVIDLGERMRVIFLDTQWWLQARGPKPQPADTEYCAVATTPGVVDSMRKLLRTAGPRATVVTGHHPMVSASVHGGYFDWPSYLFFPIPLARKNGWFAPQDVSSARYRELRSVIAQMFRPTQPLLYAAGHDHNLQILQGANGAKNLAVSGAGIYDHSTDVIRIPSVRYASEESGFLRMSVMRDGRVRMAAVVVDRDGDVREDGSYWLEENRRAPAAPAQPTGGNGPVVPAGDTTRGSNNSAEQR